MNALIHPIPHTEYESDCYGCWFSGGSCRDVCSECGCRWDIDLLDMPNRQDEACEGCDCHTWTLVESRAQALHEDSLEAAWRDVGYADSYQVYLSEGR